MKSGIVLILMTVIVQQFSLFAQKTDQTPPAPLYADPIYNGSRDPEIVYNPYEKEYWIYYTGSRPYTNTSNFVGTPIGIAVSKDLITWRFIGYCDFDGVIGKPDAGHTYWAPGVFIEGDTANMFVTYKSDTLPPWGGDSRIDHYKAPVSDMHRGWKFFQTVTDHPTAIDATVLKVNGIYHLWFRDCICEPCGIFHAQSPDLKKWEFTGKTEGDVNNMDINKIWYQEGTYVFYWKKKYWMITDPGDGIATYHSEDAIIWKYDGKILTKNTGTRKFDQTNGKHPSVAIINDRAFIFYHIEPYADLKETFPGQKFLCYLQMAEFKIENNKITCDRNNSIILPKF
jgi:hypothetical protein